MTYLLDTNICIDILRAKDWVLEGRFRPRRHECWISDVVAAELMFGFYKRPHTEEERRTRAFLAKMPILPFGLSGAEAYARTRADLEQMGMKIGTNDLLVAATALANGATLITNNTSEFSRVADLAIQDWTLRAPNLDF